MSEVSTGAISSGSAPFVPADSIDSDKKTTGDDRQLASRIGGLVLPSAIAFQTAMRAFVGDCCVSLWSVRQLKRRQEFAEPQTISVNFLNLDALTMASLSSLEKHLRHLWGRFRHVRLPDDYLLGPLQPSENDSSYDDDCYWRDDSDLDSDADTDEMDSKTEGGPGKKDAWMKAAEDVDDARRRQRRQYDDMMSELEYEMVWDHLPPLAHLLEVALRLTKEEELNGDCIGGGCVGAVNRHYNRRLLALAHEWQEQQELS